MKTQNYILKNKKIPCIILARKGSKSLKNKNLIKLNNKPLIQHSIDYAKKSKFITNVVVSTDDLRIFKIAKKHKCFCIYPRPKNLSGDYAKTEPALIHALKVFEKEFGKTDYYSYLQVTEPLRPKNILDKCIKNILSDSKIDSSFAGYVLHKNFWKKTGKKIKRISGNSNTNTPRQKKPPVYREDTGVALASKSIILKKYKKRIGKNVKIEPYENLTGLIDIHTIKDIRLAEKIIKLI